MLNDKIGQDIVIILFRYISIFFQSWKSVINKGVIRILNVINMIMILGELMRS